MAEAFVHLHVHTEYSFLDGACRTRDLPDRIRELGMDTVAITDHGSMFGVIEFYTRCLEKGVRPIIGCELYTAARTRFDREPALDADQGHLVVLASNEAGYRNLVSLVSRGHLEGFYYKPRVDRELIDRYAGGLIALSACLSGEIPRRILAGQEEEARALALHYREVFGKDRFFLEMQANGLKEQNLVNASLIRMSRETGIPLVATNDAHYLRREDARMHDVLLCVQTASTISDPDRMRFPSDDFYIRSPREMADRFPELPEALENTVRIAEACDLSLAFGQLRLPRFRMPSGHEAEQPLEFLTSLAGQGLKVRYGDKPQPEAIERLNYELGVISGMGYVDYYLIVWDFVRHAVEKGIPVGPGRGSGAASIVAYCIGITDIDPLRYNLIFERFLNPERISMPDFDIDYCDRRRQEVIEYVVNKYGAECVAQIGTFSYLKARSAVRDVGRAMGIPIPDVDRVAKMMNDLSIEKAVASNPELAAACAGDPVVRELVDTAMTLEGMPRQSGVHPAGVVIADEPLKDMIPVMLNKEGGTTTQFPMGQVEALGFMKMDFLGLRTLTVLQQAADMIRQTYGIAVDLTAIPEDDPKVYAMIAEGRTAGVFQLESGGMTRFMKDLKPENLEDIIAGISLFRPGPMEQIPRYIENKRHPERITCLHPLLQPILEVTYGCLIYQEQVMQIVRDIGGYSMARSDLVRKAMSKKQAAVMEQERHHFIYGILREDGTVEADGALRRGVSEEVANRLFDQMMDFASYAFNKAHAAAYAVIAYRTAWLKAYYPGELLAATLNSYSGDTDRMTFYIQECRAAGLEVLPPDINESEAGFAVTPKGIRFGLAAVKNVGEAAVEAMVQERRDGGLFTGFPDFCLRAVGSGVTRKSVECLIKCGAFDGFGIARSRMLAVLESLADSIAGSRGRIHAGQLSLMDMAEGQAAGLSKDDINVTYPTMEEFPHDMLCGFEKDLLGVYITGHPVSAYADLLAHRTSFNSRDLAEWAAVHMAGAGDANGSDGTGDGPGDVLGDAAADGILGRGFPGNGYAPGSVVGEGDGEGLAPAPRDLKDGMEVMVGGMVTDRRNRTTKAGRMMATFQVEDLYGRIEVMVFPSAYESCSGLIHPGSMVLVRGRLLVRVDEMPKVACEEIIPLDNRMRKTLIISLPCGIEDTRMAWLRPFILYFQGDVPVRVINMMDGSDIALEEPYRIDPASDFVIGEITRRIQHVGGTATLG